MAEKIKLWLKANNSDIYLSFIIVMVAIIGFALGKISALKEEKFDIKIESASLVSPSAAEIGEEGFVASKNGTAYHLLSCPGAKQIKEENKIYFSLKEDAEKAGYRPAANCPELPQ